MAEIADVRRYEARACRAGTTMAEIADVRACGAGTGPRRDDDG